VRTAAYAHEPAELHHTAWVATTNGAFAGHLFYWSRAVAAAHGPAAAIFTNDPARSEHPKVLWIARRPTRVPTIAIAGRRLDAPGSFRTVEHSVGGTPPQFPSYVEIPAAGCWRVTVSAGRLRGSVVFAAYDR
jgi:hypothetical protein